MAAAASEMRIFFGRGAVGAIDTFPYGVNSTMTQVGQTVKRDTTRCGIRSKWGPQYWQNGHFRRQGSRIRIFRLFRILHLVAKSVHVRAALEGKMTTAELTSAPPSKNDIELARNSGRTLARLARRDVPLTMRVRDAGQEETLELP